MADELELTIDFRMANGSFDESFDPETVTMDQTTVAFHGAIVDVGTSEETISFGDVTTPKYLLVKNLDSTNYVTYGPDSTGMVTMGQIKAGEVGCIPLNTAAVLKWQADTASVKVQVFIPST